MNMKLVLTPFTMVALVMTGLFLILYWIFVLPQFHELASDQQQLEQFLTTGSAQLKQTSAAGSTRKQAIADLESQADALLPLSDNQYDLSVQLEASARSAGITITSLAVNAPALGIPLTTAGAAAAANTGNVPRLTFTFGVSGGYNAVRGWITKLVSFDRFVQLDTVAITAKSTDQAPDGVDAQVTGFAYYLPTSSTATKP